MSISKVITKKSISLLVLTLLFACNGRKPASIDPKVDFDNILVTGASISANWKGVESPGLRIANAYNSKMMIKAHGGKRSEVILKGLENFLKMDISLIIGLDLFFWDSVSNDCSTATGQVDKFLGSIKDKEIKVILGNIPPLVSNMNCRSALNDHLENKCGELENCHLFDFDTLVHELKREDLGKYFQSDKIHLTDEGSKFAAKALLEDLSITDHPEIK